MLFVFIFMFSKQMYTIPHTFITFNMFNLLYTQLQLSHKKIMVKILDFEVSFNQLIDKVRRNVKLSKYQL